MATIIIVFSLTIVLMVFSFIHARLYIKKMNTIIGLPRFIWDYLILEPIVFLFRWLPGGYGIALRTILYKVLLKKVGKGVVIRDGVKILFPERVEIGKYTGLNDSCIIDGTGGVKIGSYVRMAPRVEILTSNHIFTDRNVPIKKQGLELKAVVIEDDVWVGIGALLVPGVHIGHGAVIAGHAVVTKNVPPFAIVAGIPAVTIGQRS